MDTRLGRLSEQERFQVYSLMQSLNKSNVKDKNALFAQFGELMSKTDSFDPDPLPLHDEEE